MPRKLFIDYVTDSIIEYQDLFLEQVYHTSRLPCLGIAVNNIIAFERKQLIKVLTNQEINLIRSGRNEIYFVNSHESFPNFVDGVYEQIHKLQIPYDMVTICSEAAEIADLVDKYAIKNSLPKIKSIWTRRFEHDIRTQKLLILERNHENLNLPRTLKKQSYDKKFLLFNRRWRDHRPLLVAFLKLKDILHLGHVSLAKSDDNFGWQEFSQRLFQSSYDNLYGKDIVRYLKSNITIIDNIPDLYLDTTDLVSNRAEVDVNGSENYLYESTYFSVVSETNYFTKQANTTFFSEKIFKPIANRHPFLVVSTPGFLSKLRALGYKTFSPWINEAYDLETDDTIRIQMIVEEIHRLCMLNENELQDFLDETFQICEHNYYKLLGQEIPTFTINECSVHTNLGKFKSHLYRPDFANTESNQIISDIKEKLSLGHSEYVFYGARESILYNHLTLPYLNSQTRWKNYSYKDKDTKYFPMDIFPELTKIHMDIIPGLTNNEIQKLTYVSATINSSQIYKSYCEVMRIPQHQQIKVVYDNFYGGLVSNYRDFELCDNVPVTKTHKYLCYNRMPHIHRLVLIGALKNLDLIKHGKISMYTNLNYYNAGYKKILDYISEGDCENCWHHNQEFYDKVRSGLAQCESTFPWKLSLENHGDNPCNNTLNDHLEHASTFFSIITETGFYNRYNKDFCFAHNIYLTEKTYKAIKHKHPFILVGAPNSLLYLRQAGFKTFNPFINETYDVETNDDIRMQRIINEIHRLCDMSMSELSDWKSSMNQILEHNYNILHSLPRSPYE